MKWLSASHRTNKSFKIEDDFKKLKALKQITSEALSFHETNKNSASHRELSQSLANGHYKASLKAIKSPLYDAITGRLKKKRFKRSNIFSRQSQLISELLLNTQ